MLSYIEYLNLPTKVGIILVGLLLFVNIVGEILELVGFVVPQWMKVRKYFDERKKEKEKNKEILNNMSEFMSSFLEYYSEKNIEKRNAWMESVNNHVFDSEKRICEQDGMIEKMSEKLDSISNDLLDMKIEDQRNIIIDFAARVANNSTSVTREQFRRVLRVYEDYERTIDEEGKVNGEVEIAHRIIVEAYEERMLNSSFIEDIRGYNI